MRATDNGADLVILGEMGIGNTTAGAAIAAALLGAPAEELVGAGTGLDAEGVAARPASSPRRSASTRLRGAAPPLQVLACVGGLEIAALTGAIIAAAQARIPVLIDGFIVSVAALAAVRTQLRSARLGSSISHRSLERGHRIVLDALGAEPILDLKLRLGEGSGAAVALPILRLACALHAQMATFEEARISGPAP